MSDTLGATFLAFERRHDRPAVLEHRVNGTWHQVPDWRFLRQVIRVALYLRERAGVEPGDRVAVLGPVRAEAVVTLWAAAIQGAVVDPTEADGAKVVLGAGTAGEPAGAVIESADGQRSWTEVLDLGGTLDTAERANGLRERCRTLAADAPAEADGTSHGELCARARQLVGRRGGLAYVAAGGLDCPVRRLALWAFVGDGVTRLALGSPGRAAEEIAALAPQRIVAPPHWNKETG
jgi:hypothetical protein